MDRKSTIPSPRPRDAGAHRAGGWIGLALLVTTLAVYVQVRGHDFVNYDDPDYVTENPYVRAGLTRKGLVWALTRPHQATWHPLTSLSHMLDCQLWGLAPGPHHLTNVALHAASTLVLFALLTRMTRRRWPSAVVAGLFALHPLHVESVAWVAERKDVLSALFWMLTLWAYVRFTERPSRNRYAVTLFLFGLGLLAKPMVVTLPFVLLLLDYWPLDRLCRQPRHVLLEKVPFLALAAVMSVVTFLVQRSEGAVSTLAAFPLSLRLANAILSYATYLWKTVVPTGLAVFYPYRMSSAPWQVAAAGTFLVAVSLAVARGARCYPYLLVGWLWYLGTLVPVIGLVKQGDQAMADRFTYVPLIGIFLIVAWGVPDLLAGWRRREAVLAAAAGTVLAGCAAATWVQLGYWRDDFTLLRHAVAVTDPNPLAHNNLGVALFRRGDTQAAIGEYTRALAIKPDDVKALVNLGMALDATGQTTAAIDHYTRALEIDPDYAIGHFNLALALAARGESDQAAAHLDAALRRNPDYAKAHAQLGVVRAAQGHLDEAIARYRAALALQPDLVAAHGNLAITLEQVGRSAEAIAEYSEAVRLSPADPMGHYNLASALAGLGRTDEAIAEYRAALRDKPDWPPAVEALAALLAPHSDPIPHSR